MSKCSMKYNYCEKECREGRKQCRERVWRGKKEKKKERVRREVRKGYWKWTRWKNKGGRNERKNRVWMIIRSCINALWNRIIICSLSCLWRRVCLPWFSQCLSLCTGFLSHIRPLPPDWSLFLLEMSHCKHNQAFRLLTAHKDRAPLQSHFVGP